MSQDPPEAVRVVQTSLGYGYTIMLYAGTLIIVAGMLALLNEPFDAVTGEASARSSTNASAQGITWMTQAWDWMPLWVALLGVVMLIGGAVIESGRRL